MLVSSPETTSQIHLRVTRSMTVTTAIPRAAGEVRAVVDPDRVALIARPLRERPPLATARPAAAPAESGPVQRERASRSRARPTPGRCRSRGARACDASGRSRPTRQRARGSPPARRRAGRAPRARRPAVLETAGGAALAPAPRPRLAELQVRARAAVLPARRGRRVDQFQHARLGGRLDAARDRATQSQRPFPSASINLTPRTSSSVHGSPRRAGPSVASACGALHRRRRRRRRGRAGM